MVVKDFYSSRYKHFFVCGFIDLSDVVRFQPKRQSDMVETRSSARKPKSSEKFRDGEGNEEKSLPPKGPLSLFAFPVQDDPPPPCPQGKQPSSDAISRSDSILPNGYTSSLVKDPSVNSSLGNQQQSTAEKGDEQLYRGDYITDPSSQMEVESDDEGPDKETASTAMKRHVQSVRIEQAARMATKNSTSARRKSRVSHKSEDGKNLIKPALAERAEVGPKLSSEAISALETAIAAAKEKERGNAKTSKLKGQIGKVDKRARVRRVGNLQIALGVAPRDVLELTSQKQRSMSAADFLSRRTQRRRRVSGAKVAAALKSKRTDAR